MSRHSQLRIEQMSEAPIILAALLVIALWGARLQAVLRTVAGGVLAFVVLWSRELRPRKKQEVWNRASGQGIAKDTS
jgi:hypothetical protein